ncbi:MAG: ribonuclease E/G [Lachnospiraceae bacterium]
MERKLVITQIEGRIISSIIENGAIIELHCSPVKEKHNIGALGDIYVGRVKNIVPNIGAAFIEIAPGVECYFTLDTNKTPIFTHKIGKKPLCIGDELLVQIQKEAVKTKQPTVTSNFDITGKYAVLTYGDTRIGVSGKIGGKRKKELQELVKPYESKEYGFIIRTNAKDCPNEILLQEILTLQNLYRDMVSTAQTRICYSCLLKAPKSYLTDLKNIYQQDLECILIEDDLIFQEVQEFLAKEQPEELEKLFHYEDSLLPLHKLYSVETAIQSSMKERVWLNSGGYLVIQYTEAMTVMDVNTGKCTSKKNNEETYLKINLEAAKEAAKQMRLRNLSGIIMIDFINLEQEEHTKRLVKEFRQMLREDPIQTNFVDVTKLQLVEVTRKKVRKPFYESYQNDSI